MFCDFYGCYFTIRQKDFVKINQQIVEGCSLTCIEEHDGIYQVLSYNDHHFLPHVMHASFAK